MTTNSTRLLAAVALTLALVGTGCSSNSPSTKPSTPRYDSFESISSGLGCKTMAPSAPFDSSIQAYQECNLGDGETFLSVLQFEDGARRDALLKSPSTGMGSWLVLSEHFVVGGMGDDIIAAHDKLKDGEVRAAVVPSESEEPQDEDDSPPPEAVEPEVVSFGKVATYYGVDGTEQVKIDTIYCDGKTAKDSCRETRFKNIVSNPEYGGDNDPDYKLPQYIDAKAAKGDEFFQVAIQWKNVGKKPTAASSFGTLVSANGTQYQKEDEYSATLTEAARGNDDLNTTGKFNPGKGFRIILVYSVPKGTKVAGVNWGIDETEADPTPTYTLAVK